MYNKCQRCCCVNNEATQDSKIPTCGRDNAEQGGNNAPTHAHHTNKQTNKKHKKIMRRMLLWSRTGRPRTAATATGSFSFEPFTQGSVPLSHCHSVNACGLKERTNDLRKKETNEKPVQKQVGWLGWEALSLLAWPFLLSPSAIHF